MKKILIGSLAVFAFAFASCQQSSQPGTNGTQLPYSSPNAATQLKDTINVTVIDTCCNDTVTITGNLHTVMQITGNHTHLHDNGSSLVGLGTSGATYHGNITINEQMSDSDTLEVASVMFTSSNGCKFSEKILFHVVYDANGVPHAQVMKTETTCV